MKTQTKKLIATILMSVFCGAMAGFLVANKIYVKPEFTFYEGYFGGPVLDGEAKTTDDSNSFDEEVLTAVVDTTGQISKDIVLQDIYDPESDSTTTAGLYYEYTYLGEDISFTVNLDGFNQCMDGMYSSSSLAYCTGFLKKQINDNLQWAKEAIDGRLAREVISDSSNQLNSKDF